MFRIPISVNERNATQLRPRSFLRDSADNLTVEKLLLSAFSDSERSNGCRCLFSTLLDSLTIEIRQFLLYKSIKINPYLHGRPTFSLSLLSPGLTLTGRGKWISGSFIVSFEVKERRSGNNSYFC